MMKIYVLSYSYDLTIDTWVFSSEKGALRKAATLIADNLNRPNDEEYWPPYRGLIRDHLAEKNYERVYNVWRSYQLSHGREMMDVAEHTVRVTRRTSR